MRPIEFGGVWVYRDLFDDHAVATEAAVAARGVVRALEDPKSMAEFTNHQAPS
jgi:hypothetical protein